MLARMIRVAMSSNDTVLLLPRDGGALHGWNGGRPSGEECQIRTRGYRGDRAGETAFGILERPAGERWMSDAAYAPLSTEHGDRVLTAYREQFAFLRRIAAGRFRIPAPDADAVVHEVFVTYLRRREKVMDERRWLIAAVCNASRVYWRTIAKHEALHDSRGPLPSHADVVTSRVDARMVLGLLPSRCREVLRLKFYEGFTADDLAGYFETTAAYAKLMVHRCMSAARNVLHAGDR